MAFYLKCKMCGGDIEIQEGSAVGKCKYCGSVMTLPKIDSDKKAGLFNSANEYRQNNEFDKAYDAYKAIIEEEPEEAEAYWGMILSEYGIEYVEDPKTGNRIPTCHRVHKQFIQNSSNYKLAIKYAGAERRMMYEEEAEKLDDLQKEILSVSSRELPYDVFISYKETDDATGERTESSVLAQEIYNELTRADIRTFFSRITLEEHLGENYEPYIYAALHSAKVMLVVTTDRQELNSVWVKNEWMRYLHFMEKDKSKSIIPVYKNISPYELPTLLSAYQASDMSKLGAIQDLVHGIERILGQKEVTEKDKLLNKVIEEQKQKMEAEQQKAEARHQRQQEKKAHWQKHKKKYMAAGIIAAVLVIATAIGIPLNNNYLKPKKQYDAAVETLNNATLENGGFEAALAEFEELGDFKDSKSMISRVYYEWALADIENGEVAKAENLSGKIEDSSIRDELAYKIALAEKDKGTYTSAIKKFDSIKDYKDAEELFNECCEKYYAEAEAYYSQGQQTKAYDAFKFLAEYSFKDSKERAEKINSEITAQNNAKREKEAAIKAKITGTWTLNGSTFMLKADGSNWDTFEDQYVWEDFKNFGLTNSMSYDEETDTYILECPFWYKTYQAKIDGNQMVLSILSDERPDFGIRYDGTYTKTSDNVG